MESLSAILHAPWQHIAAIIAFLVSIWKAASKIVTTVEAFYHRDDVQLLARAGWSVFEELDKPGAEKARQAIEWIKAKAKEVGAVLTPEDIARIELLLADLSGQAKLTASTSPSPDPTPPPSSPSAPR